MIDREHQAVALRRGLLQRLRGELAAGASDAGTACRALLEAANRRGTADNLTAALRGWAGE